MIAALAAAALAQAPASPEYITPDWMRRPSLEEVGRVYPRDALNLRLDADVVLECVATAAGRLTSCKPVQESPPGRGFGVAAVKLQPIYAFRPLLPDGRSVAGGLVRIPVHFGFTQLERLGFLPR